jgi:ADP-heptose:LPS heptosyltransferase
MRPPAPPEGSAESPRSIAIIRALALGDLLCAVPSFRALRHRFPDARISLIGLPWAAAIVERYPEYLDQLVEFPGFPGIPEVPVDPDRIVGFLAAMRQRPLDLVVQLHGDGSAINAFAGLLGARRVAGFYPQRQPGLADPAGVWVAYPEAGSEVERLLAVPAALGADGDPTLEFPIRRSDREGLAATLATIGAATLLGDPFVVVHPGSSTPERRWPAGAFAAVADALAIRGVRTCLTGTAGERHVIDAVRREMTTDAIDLGGRTSLGELAALVAEARLLVANDTGVSHLAAALRTPSVIVFSGSDRERWAPIDDRLHRPVGWFVGSERQQATVDDVLDEAVGLLALGERAPA